MTQVSDIIAQRALDFISACENAGLNNAAQAEILAVAKAELFSDHNFHAGIRRSQTVNKVSVVCERLRRGESLDHKQGEVKS
jgi:hypothetical protein